MRSIDKYIIYSSIFALFSEDFNFHYGIDIKLFYAIIFINTILLLFKKSLFLNKNLFLIISLLFLHGIITFLIYGSSFLSLIAQLVGISVSSIFFYSFLTKYGKTIAVNYYLKVALIVACLAIPMFYLRINVFVDGDRLNGILNEPAHYAAIMLPAAYLFFKRKNYYKFFIVLITILLSKSSMGYLGLILILVLPLVRVKYIVKYALPLILLTGFISFYFISRWDQNVNREDANAFLRRAKQTHESWNAAYDGKFKQDANLSSYALLSNAYVTRRSFMNYPFGTGIGSYANQYEKYYPELTPPDYLVTLELSKINKQDANSLIFRLVVDLGVFSFIFILYFFVRSIQLFRKNEKTIQQGMFFYLFVKLIREGHYFPPEFYFFLLIFLKDFDGDVTYNRKVIE